MPFGPTTVKVSSILLPIFSAFPTFPAFPISPTPVYVRGSSSTSAVNAATPLTDKNFVSAVAIPSACDGEISLKSSPSSLSSIQSISPNPSAFLAPYMTLADARSPVRNTPKILPSVPGSFSSMLDGFFADSHESPTLSTSMRDLFLAFHSSISSPVRSMGIVHHLQKKERCPTGAGRDGLRLVKRHHIGFEHECDGVCDDALQAVHRSGYSVVALDLCFD